MHYRRLRTSRKAGFLERFKKNNFFSFLSKIKIAKPQSAKPDYYLLGIVGLILVFGLIMLSSASSVKSYKEFGTTYHIFWHQVINGLLPGILCYLFLSRFDYKKTQNYALFFFGASVILLVLVFIPGIGSTYGSAKSWIHLGILNFQPAEVVKLLLIMTLAGWFTMRGQNNNSDFWNGLVPFCFLLGIISLLIVLQPDLGTLMVIAAIAVVMYYLSGAKLMHIVALALAGVLALSLLIIKAPYRAARLTIFLNPQIDPQGIGYHINQAFLAIGSGGFFGMGFGQSRQKFAYLPEVIGDSIFAVIAEELGFIFAGLLVFLFILLAWRGLHLALKCREQYDKLIVAGIISWFSFQAFFNIAAMVGLMPLTGIPLPFISYGGTALAVNLAALGLLINISKHNQ